MCIFVDGELKKTKVFEGKAPLVGFINGEIVVATANGKLTIMNENLDIKKEFTAGTITGIEDPQSLSGNKTFIAVGNRAGVVRYYERNGDKNPLVRYKMNFRVLTFFRFTNTARG